MRYQKRTEELQRRLKEDGYDVAILSDEGSIYYYAQYHSYLYMTFGRPTMMVVPVTAAPTIITPTLEEEMCRAMSWVEDVRPWLDGLDGEWRPPLEKLLGSYRRGKIGIEHDAIPQTVRDFLSQVHDTAKTSDISQHVSAMRMIKDADEIKVARDAGKMAIAMVEAARDAIGVGVPEYEVALAAITAGTRKAAELSRGYSDDPLMSPTIHFHQIMSSGRRVAMCHHRSTTRTMEKYDPIFLCFCGHAEYRQFKIGFDRMYFIGDVKDEYARMYEIALKSQKAGMSVLRPGVTAEEVHRAYADVIRGAGFEYPYRHGRAVGYSFVEKPELKFGDKTVLRPGMIFAMDGGATKPGVFRSQVGDTVLVTENGCEVLTPFPKDLGAAIVGR
jgi:Xaa-Pro aminopeptidase